MRYALNTISFLILVLTNGPHALAQDKSQPAAQPQTQEQSVIKIPGGDAGIGFDDLRFSMKLGRVLVPSGRTGSLNLIDPVAS